MVVPEARLPEAWWCAGVFSAASRDFNQQLSLVVVAEAGLRLACSVGDAILILLRGFNQQLSPVAVECLSCLRGWSCQADSPLEFKSSPYQSYLSPTPCSHDDDHPMHQAPPDECLHSAARLAAASWSSDDATATPTDSLAAISASIKREFK